MPQARYHTVHALFEDVQRRLQNRPIKAMRYPPLRRARKLIARHKVLSVVVFAALAITGGSSYAYLDNIQQKNIELSKEVARSKRLLDFVLQTFMSASPLNHDGKELTVYDALLQANDEAEKEFINDADFMIQIKDAIALSMQERGKQQQVIEVLTPLIDYDIHKVTNLKGYAQALDSLWYSHMVIGQTEPAKQLITRAFNAFSQRKNNIGYAIITLDYTASHSSELDENRLITLLDEAIAIATATSDDDTILGNLYLNYCETLREKWYSNKAKVLLDKAQIAIQAAIEHYTKAKGPIHPLVLNAKNTLSVIYKLNNKLNEARSVVVAIEPAFTIKLRESLSTYSNYQLNFADILLQLNELETAAKRTESIHQRIIEELGKQSMRVSFSHVMLGKIYRRMKQCDKAKQHISQAHQIRSKLVEPDSIFIKETQEMLDQGCDSTS